MNVRKDSVQTIFALLLAFSLAINLLFLLVADVMSNMRTESGRVGSGWSRGENLPPRVVLRFADDNRLGENFGLTTTDGKKLTYDEKGGTNNCRVLIDGKDHLLGEPDKFLRKPMPSRWKGFEYGKAVWTFSDKGLDPVTVEQVVSLGVGLATGERDVVRIAYRITNKGTKKRSLGLRLMLDTFIGENDGVPFIAPGHKGLVDKGARFSGAASEPPDYIQALERPVLTNPGVVVSVGLAGGGATPPDQVTISAWDDRNPLEFPGWVEVPTEWDYFDRLGGPGHPFINRKGDPDSAIGIYYGPEAVLPGDFKDICLFYGLGMVSAQSDDFGLAGPREILPRRTFKIVALVKDPAPNSHIRIELSEGLEFDSGDSPEKTIERSGPKDEFVPLSWKIRCKADAEDEQEIRAVLGNRTVEHAMTVDKGVIPYSPVNAKFLWLDVLVEIIVCTVVLACVRVMARRR